MNQSGEKALVANTMADMDRVIADLRSDLEEHLRLATDPVEAKAIAVSFLSAITHTRS